MRNTLLLVISGVSLMCGLGACQMQGLGVPGRDGAAPVGGKGDAGGATAAGGRTALGGSTATGGATAIGGSTATGGVTSQAGASASAGATSSGGTVATGGLTTTGGAGGRTATGGATGGATARGGTTATGGVITGGMTATGGTTARGGTTAGGTTATGGGTARGGTTATGGGTTGGTTTMGGTTASGGTTSTGGGKMCGGIAGLTCAAGQFCDLTLGDCGKIADGSGTCAATGSTVACSKILAFVCGCDGTTYSNDCVRQAAGVSKAADGPCPAAACPADVSQIMGWPCTEGLTCEYGTDPRPSCREDATCTNGSWTITMPKCVGLPPVTCPATREAAAGQSCPTQDAYCTYADLTCQCTNCTNGPVVGCGGPLTWHCAIPNADAACPAGIPLLGSACTTANKTCRYACGPGGARLCQQGAWYTASGGPCPVSSRRAKKNILYLSEAERQRVAEDLARFKLATYEYRDPALGDRRYLGFIIEDVPGSPAVDRDGTMVDLYGYTSMLVAAVQAQGEALAKLQAELAQVKHRLRAK